MKNLRDLLIINVDILEDLIIFLDEENELSINDVVHLCNAHGWDLISPMDRCYGIYDKESDVHITFTIDKENGFVQNYTNCKEWHLPFPRRIHKGKPFCRRHVRRS
jgi:hypothetical protein